MYEDWPMGQPQPFGDNNGCLIEMLKFMGGVAILTAIGVYVPTSASRQNNRAKSKIETAKQDSIVVSTDSALFMIPNGKVFDYKTNQLVIDMNKNNLAMLKLAYSKNHEKVK